MNANESPKFPFALAAKFLREYAERLSRDGCNDCEIAATPENVAFWLSICKENELEPEGTIVGGNIDANNVLVVDALADAAIAEAACPGVAP